MIDITIYDRSDGQITSVKTVAGDHEISDNVSLGRGYILGTHDPATEYVDAGAVAPRPVVPPMTGMSYDLSALPVGATVTVTDQEGAVTVIQSQPDTLQLVDAGAYRVRSDSQFPWVDFDVEVIVR